jgi:hypothetical protein
MLSPPSGCSSSSSSANCNTKWKRLTLEQCTPAFLLVPTGLACAALSLAAELLLHNHRHRAAIGIDKRK